MVPLPAGATAGVAPTTNFGPYDVTFLQGSIGVSRPLPPGHPVLAASASWSLSGWINSTFSPPGVVIVAAIGDPATACRCLILRDGRLGLRSQDGEIISNRALTAGAWHVVAVSYDGTTARLYVDGGLAASRTMTMAAVSPVLNLAPAQQLVPLPAPTAPQTVQASDSGHFGGSLAHFLLQAQALDAGRVRQLAQAQPDFSLIVFHNVGVGWPWQERSWRGLQEPQDPWTLPRSNEPPAHPSAAPLLAQPVVLTRLDQHTWTIGGWRLAAAPQVSASPAQLSAPGFDDSVWQPAVVPGTVLTTLVKLGVYPDPAYGLNNMAIPESLCRQDYWYRTSFELPESSGRRLTLTFNGINYSAEVWLNGERLGTVKGAFARGIFDITERVKPGARNVLAVRVSPPPHPGIPHEESIAAGPGENGGSLAIDGPTFIATEGWDWIPGIRDRNTGIWQDVELHSSGAIQLGDPHVITLLPLPRTDEAEVAITVPVENHRTGEARATIVASFDQVTVKKSLSLPSGRSQVELTPREFPQLRVHQPRLWWPNGYGKPDLYNLKLSVLDADSLSDSATIRFGIREITYELSLFDHQGRLRRVEIDPTQGSARGERLIDVRHEAIKQTPNGWAATLTAAGESSPAVREAASTSLAPYLLIRVNGVAIAARGGNWGTDDLLKRVSRERLEPYFRLHQAAHLNIIRNWLGQNTEEVFYDLADEYGLLVLNDFWASTQNFQVEPQDPQLFLANAREVLLRFRNHPSIVAWFGRNEGVPQPIINEGLADLIASLDGTRYYTGSSNHINLQGSGPYNYRPPADYFTSLAQGFSVEVGTPSLSTLESLEATIPAADRWPISDTLAYHDWHFGGNGDVATFMAALTRELGAPTGLADFERKAQMLNYVSYRAIFEGMQAHLWTRNSGRLLWMTHPAWPSNMWQIYSSDYDTQASYYGVKLACEPLHAQMNLPDFSLAVVNTTTQEQSGLSLSTRVLALSGVELTRRSDSVSVARNSVTTLPPIDLAPLLETHGVVLVALTLLDSRGERVSENIYWQGHDDASLQRLNTLPEQSLNVSARMADSVVAVSLENPGHGPALAAKLTALDARGQRVLPVLYSDNYVTLLPGESRQVEIQCPLQEAPCAQISLRGWNVRPTTVAIAARR